MQTFRIFVSSPGDVAHERRRVDRIVERLSGEFAGIARLEAIRWETAFYQAHAVGLIRLAVAGAASRARRRTELDHFCVEGRDRVVGVKRVW